MDNIYLMMIVALAILAVADLVVGVSNDAINFLNSAIGSKAIPFKAIMIIASLGIFVGAISSSGLMEVARKGIFVPGEFYFDEIMIIFMAVMITDILLLDFFNTLGLPTSTTVSIVFELLGAAVVMSLIKISNSDTAVLGDLGNYINTAKAMEIISGILLSVVIAFSVGAIVQYLSRLIFTFHYEKKIKNFGALFGGVALTAITYFIFMKGLKGTPYYGDMKDILEGNELYIIAGSFVLWTALSLLYMNVLKKNILIIVIAVGTFGLALAFSGNDLVNFIGVPMAAFHSYEAWSVSGVEATAFSMDVLDKKVPAEPLLLFIAGGVMVVTLWFSKKARTVADTEIGLATQDETKEKFKPNLLSRAVVKGSTKLATILGAAIPKSTQKRINSSFEVPVVTLPKHKTYELPAFDQIRASVNLMVAGVLISIATSMKLPLSTTYVTFMVAMGTSLADRAWGRESAVYRVAGVLNVIGGWFFTAFSAFVAAGTMAYLIYIGKAPMIAVLLLLAVLLLIRNYIAHKKQSNVITEPDKLKKAESNTVQGIIEESADNIAKAASRTNKIYSSIINGLAKEDEAKLKKSRLKVDQLSEEVDELRNNIFYYIKNLDETSVRGSNFYIMVLAYLTDVTQSLEYIAKVSYKHVRNHHKTLRYNQIKDLQQIDSSFEHLLKDIQSIFKNREFEQLEDILIRKERAFNDISDMIQDQIKRTRTEESSPKNTTLYFSLLLETKDLVTAMMNLMEEYYKSHKSS
ncbi:MAG: inorganic phosphate transporter [Bacteroidia bacterium]|nr:inorganic phosphate transporter [Bacteroidia bacterium]NNF30748.1 inorganic phosphate transporter [Flavobacteriaceae bacterium]MBT8277207.1 inorganic phosphate transporter [Bacteroidia bacterium]NNJ81458.1 inorganic phosphate transporter [Flavobacteriaceae bacterium]NNK54784.1 inorganic phosphate transporter [Flavobacteriaceae bacterium]